MAALMLPSAVLTHWKPELRAAAAETVENVGGQVAWRRYGGLARHSAAAWSCSNVPFITAVRTFSIRWAPRGDQRICWLALIRRCNSHCTVLSVVAVELGSPQRRAVA